MTIAIGRGDFKRIFKAVLTNLVACSSPKTYVRITGETGRGLGEETADDVVRYFIECFYAYFEKLNLGPDDIEGYLTGKSVLEYGPGDVPAVALLMIAHGAESAVCVDRFPLINLKPKNVKIMEGLLATLSFDKRKRVDECFSECGNYSSGILPHKMRYVVDANGLSGLENRIDFVYSRAVLEHVNDLGATFQDMKQAMKSDGLAIHLVDLKSHGLHRENQLDFLVWPAWLWHIMFSCKGVPNRWRVDQYRRLLLEQGFGVRLMEPTMLVDRNEIDAVRPFLAPQFKAVNDDDLSWLGFWVIFSKEGANT